MTRKKLVRAKLINANEKNIIVAPVEGNNYGINLKVSYCIAVKTKKTVYAETNNQQLTNRLMEKGICVPLKYCRILKFLIIKDTTATEKLTANILHEGRLLNTSFINYIETCNTIYKLV